MFKRKVPSRHCLPARKYNSINKIKTCLIALLSIVLSSAAAFSQTSASLGGTIMDASQAVLPGANVRAVNVDTGVEARTTANNAGVYNFPSLQPGIYSVSVEASGFQRSTKTDVRLGANSQIRLNFDLVVMGTVTEVEVTSSVASILLESGSSTGTVLQENAILELPLVANDVLELVNTMGGVITSSTGNISRGDSHTTFAGVSSANINITRDGISVSEVRYPSGFGSPSRMNPEMVGEFKMVLSPVDAELGRGAGQMQVTTRSGSNAFHGSGVWNIQNTALDAYDFYDKKGTVINPRAWRNLNNYTLTASGPIIKNKTFFFASWDQQIARSKTSVNYAVLTPCAKKGIYRYLTTPDLGTGEPVGIRISNTFTSGNNPTLVSAGGRTSLQIPSVDDKTGLPLTSYDVPSTVGGGWGGKTIPLTTRYVNVLDNSFVWNDSYGANCENYTIPTGGSPDTGWDNYRYAYDKSGYISRYSENMPDANDWQIGDGLNQAGHRWTRALNGADTPWGGNVYDSNRKAITVKIDHNINESHRVSGTYSYETNNGEDTEAFWPGGRSFGGVVIRKPQTFTSSLTSTLLPTLLNEFRFGISRTASTVHDPTTNPKTGEDLKKLLQWLLPTDDANKFGAYAALNDIILAAPGYGSILFAPETYGPSVPYPMTGLGAGPVGNRGALSASWGGNDPRFTFSDTITWMKGTHAFKGGFEFRRNKSWQRSNGVGGMGPDANVFPSIKGGMLSSYSPFRHNAFSGDPSGSGKVAAPYSPLADIDYEQGSFNETGNYRNMYALLSYMTGSIADISQYFYVTDATNPRWSDPFKGENEYISDLRNREFSFFFKDDWKFTESLTLNLGVRYEYYGVPWVDSGLTAGVRDSLKGLLGASGANNLDEWMPANPRQTDYRTEQIFIGPNSLNPSVSAFNKDKNNWAPHIGFAWQLPWFGKGLTTLRGGYSISYTPITHFDNMSHNNGFAYFLANQPGMVYAYHYQGSQNCNEITGSGDPSGCYLNFDNFGKLLPLQSMDKGFVGLPANQQPQVLSEQPIEKRDQVLALIDPDIRNPYIQNLTLSLTRNIGSHLTVDVRYIGTLTRKNIGRLNLNTANYINNGLMDELIKIRAGSNNPADFPILNSYIAPKTLFVDLTGLRPDVTAADQIRGLYGSALGSGNLSSIANSLAIANCAFESSCTAVSGQRGQVLRIGAAESGAQTPDTLIYANPQYASAVALRNARHSNYHSMQAQATMRPIRGLNFQVTYTWSRNLGSPELLDTGYTDYRDWSADYWLLGAHRSHQFNFNGNYTLPFGASGLLFRDAHGAFKKAIEGWGIGWIYSANSGSPMNMTGSNTLWANGRLDLVRPDLWDNKGGKAEWNWEDNMGYYFGKNRYMRVNDPQCADQSIVGPDSVFWCNQSLKALMDPVTGDIVFQNALPGRRGNYEYASLTGPGRWTLDMNMGKKIEFMEGKTLEIRLDAQNIFNHATPSNGSGATGPRTYSASNPSATVNTTLLAAFGTFSTKNQHRTFQAKIRLGF